jgi:hypothetical protein
MKIARRHEYLRGLGLSRDGVKRRPGDPQSGLKKRLSKSEKAFSGKHLALEKVS